MKAGANNGKSDLTQRPASKALASHSHLSPQKDPAAFSVSKRIPEGTIYGQVQLEAAKAYPTRIFDGLDTPVRIAYADLNTHSERNVLGVKLLPDGGKTAPHPQVVLFVNGPYHVETLGYNTSNPLSWTTWMEVHLDARRLKDLIEAVMKIDLKLKGFNV